jgi:hypothetical protein
MEDLISFVNNQEKTERNIIVGDFNLDYFKMYEKCYRRIAICQLWSDFTVNTGFVQKVNNPTRSR